jgi:hypothetical protein
MQIMVLPRPLMYHKIFETVSGKPVDEMGLKKGGKKRSRGKVYREPSGGKGNSWDLWTTCNNYYSCWFVKDSYRVR